MRHEIFIPHNACDHIWDHSTCGHHTYIDQSFWDWAEEHLGQSDGYTSGTGRWAVIPDTQEIKGKWEHGRLFYFRDANDAMLFKLTWL